MGRLVYNRKVVGIVLLFAVALLTLFISFQTCGEAGFFIVILWAVVPFFVLYLVRMRRAKKGPD